MFKPKFVKEGEMLLKGVKRFVNYRRDVLPAEKISEIEKLAVEFSEALKDRNEEESGKLAKAVTETCEGVGPDYRNSAIAENVEVIFVAVAIALGIRAYIAQPFKIPTGSMQPTLNGIVSYPDPGESAPPNPVVKLVDKLRLGRSWIRHVAKQDETIVDFRERTRFKFFTTTAIVCASGNHYRVPAPRAKVEGHNTEGSFNLRRGMRFAKGEVIASGYVDTGDQVIVDKFSYHFVPPRRGEVFVFTTKDIGGIRLQDPRMGSIHYIKRLGAVPGDTVLVKEPKLYHNGELAEERGFNKVMSLENGYRGYQGIWSRDVGEDQYVALGDNSFNSYDSRGWGTVPEANLVGRACIVYWPFSRHFGAIR